MLVIRNFASFFNMKVSDLFNIYLTDPRVKQISDAISSHNEKPAGERILLKGICGSAASLISLASAMNTNVPHLVICADKEEAAYFFNDLESLQPRDDKTTSAGVNSRILFFPASSRIPYQPEKTTNANVLFRAEVLNQMSTWFGVHSFQSSSEKFNALPGNQSFIIITYPEALAEKVVAKSNLLKNSLSLHRGEKLSIDFITELLNEFQFERVEFVTDPGQFSIRGGIADIFSYSNDFPYRIEFFGDIVESIRAFSTATQLSIKTLESITIIPNVEGNILRETQESIFEFIPPSTVIWIRDFIYASEKIEKEHEKANQNYKKITSPLKHLAPDELYISRELFAQQLPGFTTVEFGNRFSFLPGKEINFEQSPQPGFRKNFDLLNENLHGNITKGYRNIIAAGASKQMERLYSIFEDLQHRNGGAKYPDVHEIETADQKKNTSAEDSDSSQNAGLAIPGPSNLEYDFPGSELFTPILLPLHEGFVDSDNKMAVYTDHQIFERYHRFHLKDGYQKATQAITLKELTGLQKGDYVTHIDHGIGVFDGLEIIDAGGKPQEAIRIKYKDSDILYVSIHSLHRIAKYSGKEGATPRVNKLGTGTWQALKQKTKKKIKELAFDLVKLYAKRKAQKGFEFSPDSYLQNELEASFIYEDTPDQLKATQDVKKDMESPSPMDRLICGDVGFGKTEIAIRAAFKAVTDGKQVAVLAPTTILTLQHYKTFAERLKNFPCTVDYINRFKSARQQRDTLSKLIEGKTDILIGTHRLIGKDVQFRDLGLMIIDEEQKFGVGAKERLRTLRENVDTLTLTATPIPRTLQFSLMGARDLSVINTPPPNRFPIQTEVHPFNEETIRDAVAYEISRGGQVFFVHNKIQNIKEVAGMIQRLVPDAHVIVAHGQMEGHQLEEVMMQFIEEDFDVLVSTAIIESGLDIPNANTIIINDAHNFGLSDLHQLRGRVGRSNKKAFCYLLTPPFSGITEDARKRLNAIEKFSDLGSGFNIALRDLDIRGAGNMLGAEQSGFITEIGYEMYQKILNEAMDELKSEMEPPLTIEGRNANPQAGSNARGKLSPSGGAGAKDCLVETDFEIMLPTDYVNNVSERMSLYKELSEIENEEDLMNYENNLRDRFGDLPPAAIDLMNLIRLRWHGRELGLEKLVLKRGKMIAWFPGMETYQNMESRFEKILNYVKNNPGRCQLKEKEQRLFLTIENIMQVDAAVKIIESMTG